MHRRWHFERRSVQVAGVEVLVTGSFHPGERGGGWMAPEPPEMELESWELADPDDADPDEPLTDEQVDEAAYEQIADAYGGLAGDEEERRYEERRER